VTNIKITAMEKQQWFLICTFALHISLWRIQDECCHGNWTM